MMSASARRAEYGLDAPPVVRNLLIAGTTGILVWGAAALGLWSGVLSFTMGAIDLRAGVAPAGLCVGMGCLAMAAWMIWSSRVGKV
ncbi:MAG TPA: hypothetical protein VFN40_12820, partial [Gemmatimonadales bacterium]|nr:hypothetical protein [Gemmatimonadales bacterium]